MTTSSTPAPRPRPTMAELESAVEAYFVKRVREFGGMTSKLVATEAGIPDRMVILPDCGVRLVELKAIGGRVSAIQRIWHQRARSLGVEVVILEGREDVDRWLNMVFRQADVHRAAEFAAIRRSRAVAPR